MFPRFRPSFSTNLLFLCLPLFFFLHFIFFDDAFSLSLSLASWCTSRLEKRISAFIITIIFLLPESRLGSAAVHFPRILMRQPSRQLPCKRVTVTNIKQNLMFITFYGAKFRTK